MLYFYSIFLLIGSLWCDEVIRHPVILVPGDGGTMLKAKLTNVKGTPHFYCPSTTSGYDVLWLEPFALLKYFDDCFAYLARLHYNPITRKTSNTPGVDVRIFGWGTTDSIRWLSWIHVEKTNYFYEIASELKKVGYIDDWSVRGAPYDFRKSADEMGDFFKKFKLLIEETYICNNRTTVVLVAHSMGNLVILYFLNRMTQQWKDTYIRSFVTISAPWGGSVRALLAITSGIHFHMNPRIIPPGPIRTVMRSMTSTVWLLPIPGYDDKHPVLISQPRRNYTADMYRELFKHLNYTTGLEYLRNTQNLTRSLTPPGVEVHCLYGTELLTVNKLIFRKSSDWPNKPDIQEQKDGDGTVGLESLKGCSRWRKQQAESVVEKAFPGIEHVKMIRNDEVIEYIKTVAISAKPINYKITNTGLHAEAVCNQTKPVSQSSLKTAEIIIELTICSYVILYLS